MNQLLALYKMAEQDNIEIDCFDLPENESLCIRDDELNCYIAIDPMKLTSTAEEKRKLAHELGHCKTGSFYSRYAIFEVRGRLEWRAEKWSINKLIPKDELYSCYKNGITEPWEIAEHFNLPEEFVKKAMCYYSDQEYSDTHVIPKYSAEVNPQSPKAIKLKSIEQHHIIVDNLQAADISSIDRRLSSALLCARCSVRFLLRLFPVSIIATIIKAIADIVDGNTIPQNSIGLPSLVFIY